MMSGLWEHEVWRNSSGSFIIADSSSDSIKANIKLWQGSTCIATWPENGTGYIIFSDTATVTKGKTGFRELSEEEMKQLELFPVFDDE